MQQARPKRCVAAASFASIQSLFADKLVHGVVASLEFARIAGATSVGFLMMGFIGFFVKLVHIPINNILVGGSA